MTAYYTQDYTDEAGKRFRVEYHADTDALPPWRQGSGSDFVTEWTRRLKRPGELVLAQRGSGHFRYYDLQTATKQARYGNWRNWQGHDGAEERGKALRAAVMDDYLRLRDWCNDVWHYMGIIAFPLDEEGNELRSRKQSIWGIESDVDEGYLYGYIRPMLVEAGATGRIAQATATELEAA